MPRLPADAVPLRDPDQVMRLARLGSMHQTRLSFMRVLLRRIAREQWRFARAEFAIDAQGVGHAVYTLSRHERTYSLVAFAHDLPAELRSDRVIAEAWDATFVLFDGVPTPADIQRLSRNVPRQEAGRYEAGDLVLARANRSVRLFDHVVDALSRGTQPDAAVLQSVGYLMRTTAVYGNGKFGIADRERYDGREELAGPFQAEMLTVWLIRCFTVDLAEHLARLRQPERAVRLDRGLRRSLGIGNATGLGMAPFLVRHPVLIHRWMSAREEALRRVRSQPSADSSAVVVFRSCLNRARRDVGDWRTADPVQSARLPGFAEDLQRIAEHTAAAGCWTCERPWDALIRWSESALQLEAQECLVSFVIEPHGVLVDDLADAMAADEAAEQTIDGRMRLDQLRLALERDYAWTRGIDFAAPQATARFWYVSEEKLEPRIGERYSEAGADLEQPLAIARDVRALWAALDARPEGETVARFLLDHPEHRHIVRRVQIVGRYPYAEVRDNLIGADLRAIDLLRCKLSFFGCTRFDPRSDKWLRITLYQGAPFPDEIGGAEAGRANWGDWTWGAVEPSP